LPTFASETTLDLTDRDAVRARIAERYERGDRVATIADQEGVCVKTVRNIARRRGIPRRRPDQRERDARIATRYSGGLSKVALYGSNAALAARIMLDASPISMDRKRRTLEEIVHYRPSGRPVAGRSTKPRRPKWQPQI
jgi:hypothetical protein